jgi:H/ACA ribonucleoprotein complex subunit 4
VYVGIIKFRKVQTYEQIKELFRQFTGTITQTPPKISAVRKKPRKRTIYYLKLLEINEENRRLVLFETKVDAGTYIRSLCEDIGKKCGGARMEELRRTAVGEVSEKQCCTIHDLIDAVWLMKNKNNDSALNRIIFPPEEFINFPKAFIRESALKSVFTGAQVMVPAVERLESTVKREERVAMYCGNKFIGVGIAQLEEKELKAKRHGLAIRLERIHKPE